MGKYLGLVAVGALLLTGCASGEPEAAPTVTVTATPEAVVEAKAIEGVQAATPPSAEDLAPGEWGNPGEFGNPEDDAFYLAGVDFVWRGQRPADEQFVSAAKLACQQMDDGVAWNEVQVTSGAGPEDDAWNNAAIGQYAAQTYCTEHRHI